MQTSLHSLPLLPYPVLYPSNPRISFRSPSYEATELHKQAHFTFDFVPFIHEDHHLILSIIIKACSVRHMLDEGEWPEGDNAWVHIGI